MMSVKKRKCKNIPTLEVLCYDNFANTMENAPPMLQEIIIGTTLDIIKENVKEEVTREAILQSENNVSSRFSIELPGLIVEIMQDIILSMTENNRSRRNFRQEYAYIDSNILECAIETAENVVIAMEGHYINRAFTNHTISDLSDFDESDVEDGSVS